MWKQFHKHKTYEKFINNMWFSDKCHYDIDKQVDFKSNIGPVLVQLWHIMACLEGYGMYWEVHLPILMILTFITDSYILGVSSTHFLVVWLFRCTSKLILAKLSIVYRMLFFIGRAAWWLTPSITPVLSFKAIKIFRKIRNISELFMPKVSLWTPCSSRLVFFNYICNTCWFLQWEVHAIR